MTFVKSHYIKNNVLEARPYQESIFATATKANTLCVLPTGMGKTQVAIMLAAYRLQKYPEKKILMMAPTRPLCAQHQEAFKHYMDINEDGVVLVTGVIHPQDRMHYYQNAQIILATPQCVTAKTQVFLSNHGPVGIKELGKSVKFKKTDYMGRSAWVADVDFEILGCKGNKITPVKATKFWKVKAKRTVKIKTELKNCIETTPEHPLLTITEDGILKWAPAETLKKGQYVAMAKEACLPSKRFCTFDFIKNSENLKIADKRLLNSLLKKHKKAGLKRGNISKYYSNAMPCKKFFELSDVCKFRLPESLLLTNQTARSEPIRVCNELTDELYYIVGAMLGDGHIGASVGKGKEVVLSALDKKSVMDKFESLVFKNFGIRPKHSKDKGLVYYSTAFANLLIRLGVPHGDKAERIRVPYYVFESENKAVCNFISGIFDTDGSAAKHNIDIISSVSLNMVKDTKWLLLKLGIPSSIHSRVNNKAVFRGNKYDAKDLHNLIVSGEIYLQRLLDSCNFDDSKIKELKNGINGIKNHFTRSKEVLPVKGLLKNIRKEHLRTGEKFIDYYRFSMPSLNNVKDLALNAESSLCDYLSELVNLPFRWVKIKSIRVNKKPKWVYDLTVENTHNFVGNWLINHNTIQNDIKTGVIGLNNISLMIFDECHRAIRDYAYTYIAKMYSLNANHLILGLTASPGGDESKIKQICDNLSIASVEIRTEKDSDVIEYVKQIDTEYVKVDLPDELKKAQDIMKLTLKHDMDELRRYDLNVRGMRDLLDAQKKVMNDIQTDKKPIYFHLVAQITKCIKVYHLLEMMETQSIKAARTYITKLRQKKTSSDKRVMNDVGILNAIKIIETYEKEHPKMIKIAEILEQQLALDKNFKIIVFSHFRDNIDSLLSVLKEVKGCSPAILIGQAGEKGQTQKEQIDVIKDYEAGVYNCLITSPIGEEGLHLSSADIAIFYDSVASEIRSIQRRGRVGRTKLGKIIFLLTKNTRDETYHWVAENKEKRMKEILKGMQEDNNNEKGLMKFIKSA